MNELEKKIDELAIATANGFKQAATRTDLIELRNAMKSDFDVILDRHLQTYMHRYDELAHRVKQIEEQIGIK